MNIGYKKAYGIVMLVLGSFNLIMGLLLKNMYLALVPGAVCTLVGISMLSRAYFTLEDRRIVVRALLGPLTKTHEFDSYKDLTVGADGKVYLRQGSTEKKLPLSPSMADRDDWHRFIETITA